MYEPPVQVVATEIGDKENPKAIARYEEYVAMETCQISREDLGLVT